jgi:integrase
MLNWAVENEIAIPRNPISKGLIKSIKHTASRSKREEHQDLELSYEDAVLLLKEVQGKPAEIIFHLQMLHGLRIGEALGMTWENIDLKNNTITVNQQLQDISKKLRIGTRFESDSYQIKTIPKTVRSQRVIPLQKPTKGLLLKQPDTKRYGLVYKGVNGGGITYSNFRCRHFLPAIQALGLNLKTHDLRKFFGSWHLGVNRTDIMTVSKWMGHRDPRVTLSTYAKVIEELEREKQYDIGNALVTSV